MSGTFFSTRKKVSANGKVKWYARLTFDGRQTERFGGYEESDAYELGVKLVSDYLKDKRGFISDTERAIDKALEEFLSRPVSYKTNDLWRLHLEAFINQYSVKKLSDIDKYLIQRVKKDMKDAGKADGYVSVRLRAIRAFVRFCLFKEYIKKDPWPRDGQKSIIPTYRSKGYYYTDKELEVLTTLPPNAHPSLEILIRAIIIAIHQGWREEHIWSLTWSNYKPSEGTYLLYRLKGAPDREVRVHPNTLKAMGEPCEGRIFKNWDSPAILGQAFRRWRKICKLPRGRFHDLKHSCVSKMTDMGYTLPEISEITNTSVEALRFYQHANKQRVEEKFAGFSPLAAGTVQVRTSKAA